MSKYKVEISGIDTGSLVVLKSKEMKELLFQYRETQDESIKDVMILGNLKLVLSIVSRFSKRTDNMDDLFQIGVVGLIKAIQQFNLDVEVQFSTYAVPLIIGEIKRYLREFSPIKISRTIRDHAYLIMNKKDEFMLAHQHEPSMSQIMEMCNLTQREVNIALGSIQGVQSIFEQTPGSEGQISLIDQLYDKSKDMAIVFDKLALTDAIKQLTEKEKWMINERYFLDKTQSEIAYNLKVSQAQISRLEKNAITHLRELMS